MLVKLTTSPNDKKSQLLYIKKLNLLCKHDARALFCFGHKKNYVLSILNVPAGFNKKKAIYSIEMSISSLLFCILCSCSTYVLATSFDKNGFQFKNHLYLSRPGRYLQTFLNALHRL